jgi:hypothetical protein
LKGIREYILHGCEIALSERRNEWVSSRDILDKVQIITDIDLSLIRVSRHLRDLSSRYPGAIESYHDDLNNRWIYRYNGAMIKNE